MGEKSFNWKTLFVTDAEDNKPKEEIAGNNSMPGNKAETKFPETAGITHSTVVTSLNPNNPYLSEVIDVYQKGFDSLNLPDYDFFEFYKSVVTVGANNPQSFQMAFAMGKSIKPDLSKDMLIEKSKFYINEIEKVHTKFAGTGLNKRNELANAQKQENVDLTIAINDIEKNIIQLQKELNEKKADLQKLEQKYVAPILETDHKLQANNHAKNKMVESIQNIVNGINQYL